MQYNGHYFITQDNKITYEILPCNLMSEKV